MSKPLTSNLLHEFMEKVENLRSYMSAYECVSDEDTLYYEHAQFSLEQTMSYLEKLQEECRLEQYEE